MWSFILGITVVCLCIAGDDDQEEEEEYESN